MGGAWSIDCASLFIPCGGIEKSFDLSASVPHTLYFTAKTPVSGFQGRMKKMPQNRKPVQLLQGHITVSERKARGDYEKSMATGEPWKEYPEVKQDTTAHRFFRRLTDLYRRIDRNDALTENLINRYCLLQAECADFEQKRQLFSQNLAELMDDETIEPQEKYKLESAMQRSIMDVDRQIMSKRRMLLDIEKESLMTLRGQLAAIPPKSKDDSEKNKFNKFM